MIRGLPPDVTEEEIEVNIYSHGLEAKEVRLIRRKETGASRGFAFVEFATVREASEWIHGQQGVLELHNTNIPMQYSSQSRDLKAIDVTKLQTDWTCPKCYGENFKRRDKCYKCNAPRPEVEVNTTILDDEQEEVSSHPTNSLLLSNLDPLTVEDGVWESLQATTSLFVKNVNIGRDTLTGMSRGVCYVEMNSIVDAMNLHNQLYSTPLFIDGRRLKVAYLKVPGSGPAQSQATAALEAAQWSNSGAKKNRAMLQFTQDEINKMAEYSANLYAKTPQEKANYVEYYRDYYSKGGDPTPALKAIYGDRPDVAAAAGALGTVIVEGVEYKKYPSPDVSTYQYDESSGYYYDPLSTLYYDANSQYYFNSKTNQFSYWDAKYETFLPAPTDADKAAGDKNKKDSDKPKDKVRTAKKIQKDMEKWAKMLNQKKESQKVAPAAVAAPAVAVQPAPSQKGVEDIAFSILQGGQRQQEPEPVPLAKVLPGISGYGSEEEEGEGGANTSVAELQLTDWDSLACLLCKRQFPSREKLTKHNNMSDLHKQNLEEWKKAQQAKRLASGAAEDSGQQYRDRAKERRKKFGAEDVPPPNRFKEKFMRVMDQVAAASVQETSKQKLGEDNVGNKMLQKMGWKEGLGLGKQNQGRTEIIEAEARSSSSGLGVKQVVRGPNEDYRDVAKKMLWSRYNDR